MPDLTCAHCGEAISTAVTLAPGPEGTGRDLQYGDDGRPYHRSCLHVGLRACLRHYMDATSRRKREVKALRAQLAEAEARLAEAQEALRVIADAPTIGPFKRSDLRAIAADALREQRKGERSCPCGKPGASPCWRVGGEAECAVVLDPDEQRKGELEAKLAEAQEALAEAEREIARPEREIEWRYREQREGER